MPWTGYPLSASRTLVFLPFFVAGHLHGRSLIANYEVLGVDGVTGVLIRSGLLLAAALATVAVLVASPAKMGWLSAVGSASMAVFLLHGFALKAGGAKGLNWVMDHYGTGAVIGAALFFAALVKVELGRSTIDKAIRNLASLGAGPVRQPAQTRPTVAWKRPQGR